MTTSVATPRRALLGDRALNLLSSVIPMVGSLFCLTFLARAFTLGEMSLWALVITSVTAIQMLDLGISASIMKHGALASARGDKRTAWAYGWTSAVVFLVVAVVVAVALWVAPARTHFAQVSESDPQLILWLAVGVVFLAPTTNCFMVLQRSLGQYRRLFGAVVASQVLFVGGIVGLSVSDRLGLGSALALQNGQFLLTLLIVLALDGRTALPRFLDRAGLRTLFGFGAVMLLVNVMGALLLYAPLWVTSWLLSGADAGAFAFASTLAVAARNLPLMTLAPVTNRLAAASDRFGVGIEESRRWWQVMCSYLVVAAIGGYFVSGSVGGEEYASVGLLVAVLVIGYGVGSLSAVDSQVLRMTDEQGWEARAWVVSGALLVVLLPLGTLLWGVWGAGVAVLLTQAVGTGLMRTFVSRRRDGSQAP